MYGLTRNAFEADYLKTLESEILSSPFLGKSPLGPEFVRTQGFSIVFQRIYLKHILEKFPFLKTYLDKVLFPKSNAFYINPLVMTGESKVEAHIDCRLLEAEDVRIIPNLVSILYVNVDEALEGGELTLALDSDEETKLKPQTNDLVHFLGKLVHRVEAVEGQGRRISLVCEQYNLSGAVLDSFPKFTILRDNKDTAPRVSLLNGQIP